MDTEQEITVEFYGVPRQRTGCPSAVIRAKTVAEALIAVEQRYPALSVLQPDGQISPHYRISIDGLHFVDQAETALQPAQHVLILSADAGG